MPESILSPRALNRALLARQLLLERVSQPVPAVLQALGGIQNQYALNAYIRLWSCVADFERSDLDRAYKEGRAVQGTLMRGTIHTVAAADYHPFVSAIRRSQQAWAARVHGSAGTDREQLLARVRESLRGRSLNRNDYIFLRGDASDAAWATINTDAEVVRVPPSGTWAQRRAHLYGLADDLLGRHEDVPADQALEYLVRRYLAGFGPASARDVATYTGVPATTLKPVLQKMELVQLQSADGTTLLDVAGAPLPDADSPAPVRFLPTWDAMLLVHARRTAVLPEKYRPLIFNSKAPFSFHTFLVDGQVAGTWRHEGGRIVPAPFAELPAADQSAVDDEAQRLAGFFARATTGYPIAAP